MEDRKSMLLARGCLIVVAAMALVTAAAIEVAIRAGAPSGAIAWLVLVALGAFAWGALLGVEQ